MVQNNFLPYPPIPTPSPKIKFFAGYMRSLIKWSFIWNTQQIKDQGRQRPSPSIKSKRVFPVN